MYRYNALASAYSRCFMTRTVLPFSLPRYHRYYSWFVFFPSLSTNTGPVVPVRDHEIINASFYQSTTMLNWFGGRNRGIPVQYSTYTYPTALAFVGFSTFLLRFWCYIGQHEPSRPTLHRAFTSRIQRARYRTCCRMPKRTLW